MPKDITPFVRRWQASQRTERSGYQEHFRDLCEALDVVPPSHDDEVGNNYAFERRVTKAGGGHGFADVWKRGWFAWEYKSKGGDLKAAYRQLNEYHEALDNPPLLIVCDFNTFEVHTKFENAPSRVYRFTLGDLLQNRDTAECALPPLEVLSHVFGDFNQLRPNVTSPRVTQAAAADFLKLAQRLELERAAGPERPPKEQIAHFLMRLVFCLFADSVNLLPNHTFRQLITNHRFSPRNFNRALPLLFRAMSEEDALFGTEKIPFFNGGLFRLDDPYIELDQADLGVLYNASQHNWSSIEPSIFGTLFERSLDAAKRSMIGAHYTSPEDILLLIEPVIVDPLRRRWEQVKESVLAELAKEMDSSKGRLKLERPALDLLQSWAAELSAVRVLDPACGSGNFLYIALKRLLDLWHEARTFGVEHGLSLSLDPIPSPTQLFGIERDFYAHEIASVVVWIGFLQWKEDHGIRDHKEPVLRQLSNIEHEDAILRYDSEGKPYEPEWEKAEYIVGNPPFLGGKLLRRELGDNYVDELFDLYSGRVRAESDLVVYWFEKARAQVEARRVQRVGLLATQAIRGGANRAVLERIKETGEIFWAWSDRNWTIAGAMVHVSMLGFGQLSSEPKRLNGTVVSKINANLTSELDVTSAKVLKENKGLCFMGTTKSGPFELSEETARKHLNAPVNPNGRPNADVIRPWVNSQDLTSRPRRMYVIDFPPHLDEAEAALYELPFEYLKKKVGEHTKAERRGTYSNKWWVHARYRADLRRAKESLKRYICTTRVSVHRIFVWLPRETLPDSATFAFARQDDYFFGVLHSSVHEIWARSQGTQLREFESGFRYTPDTTFDTYPFPWPPGTEPVEDAEPPVKAIADAARELVRLRDNFLHPLDADGNPVPESELKDRTLTKLYNARPTWLDNAHGALDRAVFAAYGWPEDPVSLPDQEVLARLLALNHERAKPA